MTKNILAVTLGVCALAFLVLVPFGGANWLRKTYQESDSDYQKIELETLQMHLELLRNENFKIINLATMEVEMKGNRASDKEIIDEITGIFFDKDRLDPVASIDTLAIADFCNSLDHYITMLEKHKAWDTSMLYDWETLKNAPKHYCKKLENRYDTKDKYKLLINLAYLEREILDRLVSGLGVSGDWFGFRFNYFVNQIGAEPTIVEMVVAVKDGLHNSSARFSYDSLKLLSGDGSKVGFEFKNVGGAGYLTFEANPKEKYQFEGYFVATIINTGETFRQKVSKSITIAD